MYEYASGLIRVLEKKIFDHNDLERMIEAKDALAAFKVLNDTDYADNLLSLSPENYEKALIKDLQDVKILFEKIIENKKLIKFLFLEFDFCDIKYLLKLKFNNELKLDKTKLFKLGALSKTEKNYYLKKITQHFKRSKSVLPAKIDLFCDQEFLKTRKELARKMHDKFLQKLADKQEKTYLEKKDLVLIKEDCNNYAYGSPIVLAYYYQKINAAQKIRIIMNAKLNNIDNSILRKKLAV